MVNNKFMLNEHPRIAVIGGGPAGSFFSLYLLRYMREKNVKPEITIFQDRDFHLLGHSGCKGCAGILSIPLLRNLSEIGLKIPEEIIQGKINNYAVHSTYTSISMSNPEPDIQIVSVYRGSGPRTLQVENITSFDGWLLRQAKEQGVNVEFKTVESINLERNPIIVVGGEKRDYDLVVLASGVNSRRVPVTGLGYCPPATVTMSQEEIYIATNQVESWSGSTAHAFLIPNSGLIFGTLVPKGHFITVSVLNGGRHPLTISDFLNHPSVKEVLPGHYERACACEPKTAIGSARGFFGNGFVAIGDAAISRLYKDGIGSALLTARQAAFTAVRHGVVLEDFTRHYKPLCDQIKSDNRWGSFLFSINGNVKNSYIFLQAQHRLIGDEQRNLAGRRVFTRAAWGMFTGSYRYREIAGFILKPSSIVKLSAALYREFATAISHRSTRRRSLHVGGKKVLILGSGFGGTYVLRKLVPALNKNENVETTMVSDENFFLFSPLLHEVATGRVESRHVAYPVRRLQWRDRFNFVHADVRRIDFIDKKVHTGTRVFTYDYLVLALGGVADMSGLDKMAEQPNVFTLKTLYDSRLIRNHIIMMFERASVETVKEKQQQLLTFVVSGAGYIGVQLVTELRDFIYGSLIKYYRSNIDNIKILLVEKEAKIIPALHPKLGDYALKQLKKMGVEVRFRSRLTRIWENKVEINNEEIVPSNTVIWVSGAVANPRIAETSAAKDGIGRIIVNDFLEVPGFPGVYALGDCAHFQDKKSGEAIPRRAHIAVRQAKVVAGNILAEIRGLEKKPYYYSPPPELVSLGTARAMFRFRRLRLYGIFARFVWLGAYSLLLTGWYNRARIVIDWSLAVIFGRDTSYIKTKLGKHTP